MIIFNTAIDLKITPDNKVKILEFEASQHAGFTGYKTVTGKDMLEDVVYPWMEKEYGVPLLRPAHETYRAKVRHVHTLHQYYVRKGDAAIEKGLGRFSPKAMQAIMVSPRGFCVTSSDCMDQMATGRIVPIVNASENFLQMTANKAVMTYFDDMARMKIEGNKKAGQKNLNTEPLCAPSCSVGRDYDPELLAKIRDTLEEDNDRFVIKLPNESQHTGHVLADYRNLGDVIETLSIGRPENSPIVTELPKALQKNFSPFLVVQERINSKPIMHNNKSYDATMRAMVTITYREREEGKFLAFHPEVHVHDAYWKLPSQPIGLGSEFEQCVSFCPGSIKTEDENELVDKCRPYFAPVSDSDLDIVKSELDERLNYIFALIIALDYQNLPRCLLNDDDNKEDQVLGAMMALNSIYYNGDFVDQMYAEKVDGNNYDFEDVTDKLLALYDKNPRSALSKYMTSLAVTGRDYHFVRPNSKLKSRLRTHILNNPAPKLP